jgi:hypothetical protein
MKELTKEEMGRLLKFQRASLEIMLDSILKERGGWGDDQAHIEKAIERNEDPNRVGFLRYVDTKPIQRNMLRMPFSNDGLCGEVPKPGKD